MLSQITTWVRKPLTSRNGALFPSPCPGPCQHLRFHVGYYQDERGIDGTHHPLEHWPRNPSHKRRGQPRGSSGTSKVLSLLLVSLLFFQCCEGKTGVLNVFIYLRSKNNFLKNHSSDAHDKAKTESQGTPVFFSTTPYWFRSPGPCVQKPQLPFLGRFPHIPILSPFYCPVFLFIKSLLDISKFCRQSCFLFCFVLFCFVWEVLAVLVRCIAPISLFFPQTFRLPFLCKFPQCLLSIQMLTWLPQPKRTEVQPPGPGWSAFETSFCGTVEGLVGSVLVWVSWYYFILWQWVPTQWFEGTSEKMHIAGTSSPVPQILI